MKHAKFLMAILVVTTISITGCLGDNSDDDDKDDDKASYIDVDAEEAKELIDTTPDLIIIDVSPNYDDGHLPGAVNYYLGNGSLDEAIPNLNKSRAYLVYCHVDSVSISGAEKLVDAGFEKVYRLEGNYQAWVDAGYPVEKTEEETVTYMDVNATAAKELIDTKPDLIIIDVSPHYDDGHIPGAVNYYLGNGSLDDAIPSLDKTKEYLVYCHVDSVSISGAQKLIDAGFEKVYRLEGNYQAWVDAGYPVE